MTAVTWLPEFRLPPHRHSAIALSNDPNISAFSTVWTCDIRSVLNRQPSIEYLLWMGRPLFATMLLGVKSIGTPLVFCRTHPFRHRHHHHWHRSLPYPLPVARNHGPCRYASEHPVGTGDHHLWRSDVFDHKGQSRLVTTAGFLSPPPNRCWVGA